MPKIPAAPIGATSKPSAPLVECPTAAAGSVRGRTAGPQRDRRDVNRYVSKVLGTFRTEEGYATKTAINRATETVEATEMIFTKEMGATLDLSGRKSGPDVKDRRRDPVRRRPRARRGPPRTLILAFASG